MDLSGYKPGLIEPVDMSAFVIRTRGREIRPYNGEKVWLEPYIDSETELSLMHAREELGDEARNDESFAFVCKILSSLIISWDLTDKHGDPLPQPDTPDAIMALPSRCVLFLMNEALGLESEGEG